jgi:hypothetical protein
MRLTLLSCCHLLLSYLLLCFFNGTQQEGKCQDETTPSYAERAEFMRMRSRLCEGA